MHIQAEANTHGNPPNPEASEAQPASKPNVQTVRLVEGLPRDEIVRQIHYFRRQGEVGHRGLGFYLLELEEHEYYRPKARSAAKWAAKELEMHVKFARRLIRTARKLRELQRTDRLFASGELPWTKVEILATVATANTEEQWIEYALKHSYAELRAAAARARKKKDAVPGDGLEVGRTMYTVQHRLSATAHEVYERALKKARNSLGPGATPAEAFRKLCEMALGAPEPKEGASESGEPSSAVSPRAPCPYNVVVHVDPKGIYVLKQGPDGRPIREPVAPEELARILGLGARVVVVPPIALEGEVETIPFGERGSVPKDERAPPLTAEERELVLLRDGSRCAVCGSEKDLTIAHLVARAHGAENDLRILLVLCKNCHSCEHDSLIRLLIERGRVKALDRDGKPLDASVSDAEALASSSEPCGSETPLLVLEIPEKENSSLLGNDPSEPLPPSDPLEAPFSVRELPAEIDAATWRKLEDCLEWSPSRKAYLLRPGCERPCLEDSKPQEAPPVQAPAASAPPAAAPAEETPAAQSTIGDLPLSAQTQPRSLRDFVGQDRAVENIRVLVRAARARGEVPGHILLAGPAGLGKSTLAALVARECGGRLVRAVGAQIEPHALACLLGDLRRGDVLFLDEIHGLSRAAEEALYSALGDGFVDVVVADSAAARTRVIRVRLEPFTLVGATTTAGSNASWRSVRSPSSRRKPRGNGQGFRNPSGPASPSISRFGPIAKRTLRRSCAEPPNAPMRSLESALPMLWRKGRVGFRERRFGSWSERGILRRSSAGRRSWSRT